MIGQTISHYRIVEKLGEGRLPPNLVIFEREMHGGRLSLSYDGRSLVATAQRATGDIWIRDGFRPPRPLWKRMLGLD